MQSVRRTRARTTEPLIDALAPAVALGVPPQDVWTLGFGRFPIAGAASWVHDWWFPRFGPEWRLHEGTDVFAANGTPVRSPVDGVLRLAQGGKGGIAAYVRMSDGTYIYLAHLAAYAPGLAAGQLVKTGQVVGYVGTTGNAAGGSPHLHIEVHPRGGGPIDPKPVLDRWLADAVKRAPLVVKAYEKAVRRSREAPPPPPPPAPALTVSERRALEWEQARQRAKAYVLPLTPPLLAAFVARG